MVDANCISRFCLVAGAVLAACPPGVVVADENEVVGQVLGVDHRSAGGYVRRISTEKPDGEEVTPGAELYGLDRITFLKLEVTIRICDRDPQTLRDSDPSHTVSLPQSCETGKQQPSENNTPGAGWAKIRPDAGDASQLIAATAGSGVATAGSDAALTGIIASSLDTSATEKHELFGYYIVKPGDDLDKIAAETNTTAADLRTLNRLGPNALPLAGQTLFTFSKANLMEWPVFGKIVGTYMQNGNNDIVISAPANSIVRAAASGTVLYSDKLAPLPGQTVLISHSDGEVTAYYGLKNATVQKGAVLTRGSPVGNIGDGMLHFEVRVGGLAVDPAARLGDR
ncbi:peptidoglycan DD-metalloendopeptidase family protein [Agrobacterium rhizogenes]|uniref:M23 family metallopeptidase n=1 Tax=Rhizobium rhizogenes TaxID=359 RepID=UPI001573EA01|nr:M23 family metallopeptidase [Rhizobium rhizogenes]NTH66583.1 peptidoglycan DD-metalloendopeptidase family protein [Rhizobium rhizogenes]NTI04705.1 peptidoglycan DD-metalloendopeptidase family protein [Rhizobium rhizogenes]NTI11514.1 peptidoglycan DD-metalloendopeptidase family protein [Rhizobium rhizogenes]